MHAQANKQKGKFECIVIAIAMYMATASEPVIGLPMQAS
jgi:hypothetical protein